MWADDLTSQPVAQNPADQITKWTDSGVAERWVRSVEGRWCWTAAADFMEWNGHGWARRTNDEALESVRQFGKDEVVEALSDTASDDAKVAVKRMDAKSLKAALSLAKGQLVKDLADFDQDPDIAVAPNGVIDLTTGELLPHDPSRLVTKVCGIDYVPGAEHPDWDAALTAVPTEVADYMQVRYGQAFTGHRPDDDVMQALRGGGENAKSTVIDAIDSAFGDYCTVVSDKVLLGDTRDHSTELMDLRGARWAYVEELPEKRYLNLQRLKKINGTKKVKARYVHKDNMEFPQTWALTVSSNYDILVDEVDRGSWRRLQEIRFPYTYKKAHEDLVDPTDRRGDPRLREAVLGPEQQQAVLSWLVQGAMRWYSNDRTMVAPPERVVADTQQWRKDNDLVLAFVEDHLIVDPASAVLCTELLSEFNQWLNVRGHNRWGMNTLRSRLSENGWLKNSGARLTGRERRDPVTLSRPDSLTSLSAAPAQGQYLVGVRFRTREDDRVVLQALRAETNSAPDPEEVVNLAVLGDMYRQDQQAWIERLVDEGATPNCVDFHLKEARRGEGESCHGLDPNCTLSIWKPEWTLALDHSDYICKQLEFERRQHKLELSDVDRLIDQRRADAKNGMNPREVGIRYLGDEATISA
ncbi:DNA primase family protein [Brevibacterium casei]|uniref:DNA primase family protein n=1 Tax=Brevibacterium casei TaxID=33889 RepID=UPI0028AA975F|nr:phage/plasmid primase, P4 family [Brevibacterium casei]